MAVGDLISKISIIIYQWIVIWMLFIIIGNFIYDNINPMIINSVLTFIMLINIKYIFGKKSHLKNKDSVYMKLCETISEKSPDANTKVGCIIVKNNEILSEACNDIINCAEITNERTTRPLKYVWIEHAERNAIYKAAKKGISLNNSTIYINWWPCVDCCRSVIQCGIKRIVAKDPPDINHPRWGEQFKHTYDLLRESNIEVSYMNNSK